MRMYGHTHGISRVSGNEKKTLSDIRPPQNPFENTSNVERKSATLRKYDLVLFSVGHTCRYHTMTCFTLFTSP